MRRGILSLLLTTFCVAITHPASAQTYEQLIAGAKKEGTLILYASATAPQLQMYFAAFNKKYPFIKTEFFRTGKQALLSKILLEEQAKQRIADVIRSIDADVIVLQEVIGAGHTSAGHAEELGRLPQPLHRPDPHPCRRACRLEGGR